MKQRSKLSAIALTLILSVSCGGNTALKSFRLALAASGPLVSSLVSSGAVDQSRAGAIIADFDAGAQCGVTLQNDFAAIPKDASDARAQKLTASTKAFKCFRAVLDRQNFAAHPRLQQIANIADGVLASLVIFYSDGPTMAAAVKSEGTISALSVFAEARPAATISATNEADLERQMEAQMKALELAMKP